jgi:DedD protein
MAIFRTRSESQRGQDAARKSNLPVDSVETLRTRARQRLIGAVVLVVLGILGFSLLFDTQPRPIPVNIEISIPDKDKAERLEMPAIPTATAVATAPTVSPSVGPSVIPPVSPANPAPAAVAAAPSVQASASLSPKEELMSGKPVVNEAVKPVGKPPAEKIAAKPPVVDDGAKARALLEGRDPVKESAKVVDDKAADGASRFVVQVGAFADGTKAHEVRVKLERAGLKTYTHVAQTKDGARTRVRVGPFAKREEAEKAAAKIKKIDLPAAILTL